MQLLRYTQSWYTQGKYIKIIIYIYNLPETSVCRQTNLNRLIQWRYHESRIIKKIIFKHTGIKHNILLTWIK